MIAIQAPAIVGVAFAFGFVLGAFAVAIVLAALATWRGRVGP